MATAARPDDPGMGAESAPLLAGDDAGSPARSSPGPPRRWIARLVARATPIAVVLVTLATLVVVRADLDARDSRAPSRATASPPNPASY